MSKSLMIDRGAAGISISIGVGVGVGIGISINISISDKLSSCAKVLSPSEPCML